MMKLFWLGLFMVCGGLAIRWLDRQAEPDRVSKDWLREDKHNAWKRHLMDQNWNWDVLKQQRRQ